MRYIPCSINTLSVSVDGAWDVVQGITGIGGRLTGCDAFVMYEAGM
jgi:hypothetical protein